MTRCKIGPGRETCDQGADMGVLKPLDWIIILVYFTIILGLAWKVMREKQRTSTDYFLAGRNLGWLIIGASIFASNIGAERGKDGRPDDEPAQVPSGQEVIG